ncbi:hypothetical protein D3C79_735680 [compost metagenome]
MTAARALQARAPGDITRFMGVVQHFEGHQAWLASQRVYQPRLPVGDAPGPLPGGVNQNDIA